MKCTFMKLCCHQVCSFKLVDCTILLSHNYHCSLIHSTIHKLISQCLHRKQTPIFFRQRVCRGYAPQVLAQGGRVVGQQRVHEPEELHHPLILPQILMALQQEHELMPVAACRGQKRARHRVSHRVTLSTHTHTHTHTHFHTVKDPVELRS